MYILDHFRRMKHTFGLLMETAIRFSSRLTWDWGQKERPYFMASLTGLPKLGQVRGSRISPLPQQRGRFAQKVYTTYNICSGRIHVRMNIEIKGLICVHAAFCNGRP